MSKRIALLIGVSNYENENNLPPCDADIDLMADIIESSGKYDATLILKDSPKSIDAMAKIRSFITDFQNPVSDIDEIFFYYTGHGAKHSDDFLFLFSDFNNSKINATSLSNDDLDGMLKSLNPKLTVKVVDACQAGIEYIKSEQASERNLENILEKSKKRV
ncbi:MAG: caspase family protein [Methylovulum miyakonense]|uniref:caspase family protein n=1 Tax=Methylovulum miyakonense TaxID=645578 RepID=UPI003BB6DF5C